MNARDNIKDIVPTIAIGVVGHTVVVELICTDGYAARILFDDMVSCAQSDGGMKLQFKGHLQAAPGVAS